MFKFFRKASLYFVYRRQLLSNVDYLRSEFGIEVDYINRAYTVLNIPPGLIEEPYNIRKSDFDKIAVRYVGEYITEFGKWANANKLNELVTVYENRRLSNTSFLVIFGYSLLDLKKIARLIWFVYIPIISISIILLLKFL